MTPLCLCRISALAMLAPAAATAQQVTLGAHQHGSGHLAMAVEGNAVSMLLEVPGADIVGFEHAAASTQDRALVDAAVSDLARPLALFRFPDTAGCVVQAANVSLTGKQQSDHQGEGHEDDHAHDETEHHAEDDHATHGNEHEEHATDAHTERDGEHGEHNEFRADYMLACANPGKIDRLIFSYFDRFPNALELDVQVVTAGGARAFEVKRDDPVLDLRGMF